MPDSSSEDTPPAIPSDETVAVDEGGRIHQGDIVRWESPQAPWRSLGAIVTADCDIVQNKHADTLSYVPILALSEYWRLVTLPKKIERYLSAKFRAGLFARIRALKTAHHRDFRNDISDQAIEDLLRLDAELVLQVLAVPENERTAPLRQVKAYKAACSVPEHATLDDIAIILAELKVAGAPEKQPDVGAVFDDLAGSINDLPGDVFFIGRITGAPEGAYVAYLRLVRELPSTSVATTPRALRTGGASARRIARLRSPFVYRLTQQLAQVFADIGLPKEYEARRELLAKATRAALHPSATGA